MIVDIYPARVSGDITPPSSKSFLHRAVISASLARGTSVITNVILNDDVMATINAFRSLGVSIEHSDDILTIMSNGILNFDDDLVIDCNESGSTIRFLIPILSNNKNTYFKGKSSLLSRPFDIYEDIYENQNIVFEKHNDYILTSGAVKPGNFVFAGNISSQFITGLLFTLPKLSEDSTIEIIDAFESEQYVDLTIQVLKDFGVNVIKNGNHFFIKGNQSFNATTINCETDFSQAAFFAVLGIVNNNLRINKINPESVQPDKAILEFIKAMGGSISIENDSVLINRSITNGIVIDIGQSPDIGPIVSLLCALSMGTSKVVNASRLRMKESDRLAATKDILNRFGVIADISDDSLIIRGSTKLQGGVFDSHNDHRIAMTIAIGATVADSPVTILNAEVVNKSYPRFYKDLQSLGAVIKYR